MTGEVDPWLGEPHEREERLHQGTLGGNSSDLVVIVGDEAEACSSWNSRCEHLGLPCAVIDLGSKVSPPVAWLETACGTAQLRSQIMTVLGAPPTPYTSLEDFLQRATLYDRREHLEAALARLSLPRSVEELTRALYLAPPGDRRPAVTQALERARTPTLGDEQGALDFAAAVATWQPPGTQAALLARGGAEAATGSVDVALSRVVRLKRVVPAIPVAIALAPESWANLSHRLRRLIPSVNVEHLSSRLPLGHLEAVPATALMKIETAGGPSVAKVKAAAVRHFPGHGFEDLDFRSQAELVLYYWLEHWPETRQKFAPNVLMDFSFGNSAAEVDLFSSELRLAIELDGAHFHLPADAEARVATYRRDRAKDWLLQQEGILVLRFLSEDVFARLEEIRLRIIAAVRLRTELIGGGHVPRR